MQNRYVADIGDYVKLALIRRLQKGHRVGVIWWLHPDQDHNADGKHVGYLSQPAMWRGYNPPLFDKLKGIIARAERSVLSLEHAGVLRDALYFSEPVPIGGQSADRRSARSSWFGRAQAAVSDCDLIFVDPDNGLETKRFNFGASKAGKSIALAELDVLCKPGKTLIVYHHQTRMKGGHHIELLHWGHRLSALGFQVDAVRAAVGTARAFFIINANDETRAAANAFARDWGPKLSWHPDLGRPA